MTKKRETESKSESKPESKPESRGVEMDDNELDQVTGGTIIWGKMCDSQCPKCYSFGSEYGKQQGRTLYKCEKCGHTWLE